MLKYKKINLNIIDEIAFILIIISLTLKLETFTQSVLLILAMLLWWDKEFKVDQSKNLLILMTGGFFSLIFIRNEGISFEWFLFLLILVNNYFIKKKMIKVIYLVPVISFFKHDQLILSGIIVSLLMIISSRKNVISR